MKKRNILWLAVSIIMILALSLASACTCGTPTPTPTIPAPTAAPTQTGVVEVRAMDAPPTGVSSIVVTTSNIEVHKAGASEESWVSVIKEEKTFDLVTIQGAEVFLGQKELEAGQYTQIRLDVTNVKVVLEGKELIAKLPGEKLKVVRPWEIKPGQKTILTIDFDADKFVVITGKDQAQVKPVIKLEVSQGERPLKKPTPESDTIAPEVSYTTPGFGATDVNINRAVFAFFSEAMNPSTITAATFTLKQGTTPVAGVASYVGLTATFTPTGNLALSTTYIATITTGAKDLAGNALAVNKVWKFTTGAAPDTTAPKVSSTIPAKNDTDVAINSAITVAFSEEMNPLTLTTATFTLKQGPTSVAGTVIYAVITATFTPDDNLAPGTVYTATITTGAKDLAGNPLASNYTWDFTTPSGGGGGGGGGGGDTTKPIVSFTFPLNGATGVLLNSAMIATFSEAMKPSSLTTLTFTLNRGGTPVQGGVAHTTFTATFTPDDDLAPNTEYTATITTGAEDLAGNNLAANRVWTFTTGDTIDNTAPFVNSVIPAIDAHDVAVNSTMEVIFSEAMDPVTITTVTFTLKQGATPVTGSVIYAVTTALFLPNDDLAFNTTYTATITPGAKDLAGNALVNKVWSFTTGAVPDTTRPIVSSTIPVNGAPNVAVDIAITATFSEAMNPLTLTTGTFQLMRGLTGVAGTMTHVAVDTATFTPDDNLAPGTEYTATIYTGAEDVAGNALAVDKVWTFTTAGPPPDTTPPTVSGHSPTGIDVAVDSNIAVTFSEAMNTNSAQNALLLEDTATHTAVAGAFSWIGNAMTFNPGSNLADSTEYTVKVAGTAQDTAGIGLDGNNSGAAQGSPMDDYIWTFTTAGEVLAPGAVPLGGAGTFGIMGWLGLTCAGPSIIHGDVAVHGVATTVTGFPSPGTIDGHLYTDNSAPLIEADLLAAYDTAWLPPQGIHVPDGSDLGAFDDGIHGPGVLIPGKYWNASTITINTPVHLDALGNENAVWIFQIGSSLTTVEGAPGAGGDVLLAHDAQAKNVFFVCFAAATIGAGTTFNGNILAGGSISCVGAVPTTINGRLLGGATGSGKIALDNTAGVTINVPLP